MPAATPAVLQELDNGCRLVTERVDGSRSASLGVFVTVGSRHEPAAVAGASHFLEHLLFKGTDRLDAATIAESLDRVGGQSNAYTARELTCFWVRLLGEDLDVGLSILGDIVTDPALRPSDVDAERTVIEDEILGSHDDPASVASERFFELVFPAHPLGRDPLGTLDSVGGITPDDVRSFFTQHYGGANLVVAAAGDVDHDAVARAVAAWAPPETTTVPNGSAPPAAPARREVVRAPFEQAQVVVGVPIPRRSDPQRDAYRVYDQLLGGGLSSRLFTSIREREGLAYQVYSERAQFTDAGALCVAVGSAPEHAERVLALVAEEVDDLAGGGMTQREVDVARQALRADALLGEEDSAQVMSRIGGTVALDGAVRTLDDVLDGVASVRRGDVEAVAQHVAGASRTLVVVGPFEDDVAAAARLEGPGWR
ncbi:MAG TPA: pitrilysin family protein [Acidimicrobiales bacterium]|nr:pitrilysin family protein [Acidimicrobiales bacterium]